MSRPYILVLAGVNGAGKSSVLAHMLQEKNYKFFNPDNFARLLLNQDSTYTQAEANIEAWNYGVSKLKYAISHDENWAFETTLGGDSITEALLTAAQTHDVSILYCGLENVELHISRVQLRVVNGGHPISESDIKRRWITSISNLIKLMPITHNLSVYDNSQSVNSGEDIPEPRLLLQVLQGNILHPDLANADQLTAIPQLAKAIVTAASDVFHAQAKSKENP